ncbi:MAG: hypothetical protein DRG25_00525 [Deltaproteobacteria bacterium]|nr:MAG: hypothetical protein DRG25_00525 [Deltaproteobacteria bacterium]
MKVLKKERGFTLVELMVALVIGSLVIAAAYQVLVGQTRVYESQEQTIDMKQDARAALDFMCRELRMIGFGVDAGTDIFVSLINNDCTSDPNIDDGTDAITFTANTDYGSFVAVDADSGDTSVSVYPAPTRTMEFKNNAVVNILDGNYNILCGSLTITNDPDGADYGDPNNPTTNPTVIDFSPQTLGVTVPSGSFVTVQPKTITYRVNNTILERDEGAGFEDLIANVEDLQFVYAFDADNDGNADTDANGIIWAIDSDNNGDLDLQVNADGTTQALPSPVDFSGGINDCPIRSVRVSILVRTERENPDPRFRDQYQRPRVEDHPGAGTNDGYRRILLTNVVRIRNLGRNVH